LAGLQQGAIVFAFEQTPPEGQPLGRYLGEFQVTQSNGTEATIEPILRQSWAWPRGQETNEHMERLRTSQAPWVLYDSMPSDRYDAFAGLSEEALRALLPPEAVEPYLRHGQPVGEEVDPRLKAPFTKDGTPLTEATLATTDPADVEWRYQRPLRDYTLLFQTIARERIEKFAEHEALTTDIGLLAAAQQSADAIQAARQQEIEKLQHDLAGFQKEVAIIERYAAAIETQLESTKSKIGELLARNRELASDLSQAQLEAMRQLNQTATASAGG
jgi:hypothetical protein